MWTLSLELSHLDESFYNYLETPNVNQLDSNTSFRNKVSIQFEPANSFRPIGIRQFIIYLERFDSTLFRN